MADPFGIKANSTPPVGMARYLVRFHSVPKPHPAFSNYSGTWTPAHGLVQIRASSEPFTDEKNCSSARALYHQVKRQLIQAYGEPADHEYLDNESRWQGDNEFWQSIENGDRIYTTDWTEEACKLRDGIRDIHLGVITDSVYDSYVLLSYNFEGVNEDGPSDDYGLDSL
jgi:hypothetical protein